MLYMTWYQNSRQIPVSVPGFISTLITMCAAVVCPSEPECCPVANFAVSNTNTSEAIYRKYIPHTIIIIIVIIIIIIFFTLIHVIFSNFSIILIHTKLQRTDSVKSSRVNVYHNFNPTVTNSSHAILLLPVILIPYHLLICISQAVR